MTRGALLRCNLSQVCLNLGSTFRADSMQAVITGMCILLLVLRLAPGLDGEVDALLRCNLSHVAYISSQVCLNLY